MKNVAIVNEMTVGASATVCQLGEIKTTPDSRPYAVALTQEGYPNLPQWIEGSTEDKPLGEALNFLVDAVGRGSIPMMTVAGLALAKRPELCLEVMAKTHPKQQSRFRSLLTMGTVLGDSNQLFKDWIQALNNVAPCAA